MTCLSPARSEDWDVWGRQAAHKTAGAAAQATLQEFHNIEAVNEGGEEVRVMRVAGQKTARQGPTYLLMTVSDHEMLRRYMYVKRVRPRLDPTKQLDQLFVLHGPKAVKDPNALLVYLKGKYGVVVESSTTLRQAGETASFKSLTVKQSELVSRHVSYPSKSCTLLSSRDGEE